MKGISKGMDISVLATGIVIIAIGIVILFLTSQFDKSLSIELSALGMTAGIVLGAYGLFLCIVEIFF